MQTQMKRSDLLILKKAFLRYRKVVKHVLDNITVDVLKDYTWWFDRVTSPEPIVRRTVSKMLGNLASMNKNLHKN